MFFFLFFFFFVVVVVVVFFSVEILVSNQCISNLQLEMATQSLYDQHFQGWYCLRTCQSCNLNVVENEYHFLLVCPAYRNLRNSILPKC